VFCAFSCFELFIEIIVIGEGAFLLFAAGFGGGVGEGEGDDEVILIDFSKMPADISKIAITVTIHDAVNRKQNFGQVSNAYVRVAKRNSENDMQGEDALRFDLVEDFSVETAIVVCEIYKRNNDWKFNAVAAGYQGGLEALCRSFGVNV